MVRLVESTSLPQVGGGRVVQRLAPPQRWGACSPHRQNARTCAHAYPCARTPYMRVGKGGGKGGGGVQGTAAWRRAAGVFHLHCSYAGPPRPHAAPPRARTENARPTPCAHFPMWKSFANVYVTTEAEILNRVIAFYVHVHNFVGVYVHAFYVAFHVSCLIFIIYIYISC